MFKLPDVLPLPLPSETNDFAKLATIPAGGPDAIKLSLIQGTNHDDGRLALVSSSNSTNKNEWVVRWIPNATDLGQIREIDPISVARFSTDANTLKFQWARVLKPEIIGALRNSVLTIRIGEVQHVAGLRAPVVLPRLDVNLRKRYSYLICKYDDLPETTRIRADLVDRSSLPTNNVNDASVSQIKLGEAAVIEYVEAPGAESLVAVVRRGVRPAVQFETRYRLPSGYQDILTIQRGNRKMQELRQEFEGTKSYYELSNSSQKNQIRPALQRIEADLRALERIEELAKNLHNGTQLAFRFYFTVADHEVNLAICD